LDGPWAMEGPGREALSLLERALQAARREDRLVLVEIFDPTCKYCRAMEPVFRDPLVRKVLEEGYVRLKLGLPGNPLVGRFRLEMTPAFLIFRPGGEPMEDVLEGFRSAKVFAAELEDFLHFQKGGEAVEIPDDTHPMAGRGCRIQKSS